MGSNINLFEEKTRKVVDLANELADSSKGNIVYISNCSEAKGHLKGGIKFLDLSEVEKITPDILKSVINQIAFDSSGVEVILLDNLSKMISEDDIGEFIKDIDNVLSKNNIKILFGLDRENKDVIKGLDIEKID